MNQTFDSMMGAMGLHRVTDTNVESVREKLLQRSQVGITKYGVTTNRTDTSTIEWLNHFQQELMDAAVYVERIIKDLEGKEDETTQTR